MYGRAWPGVNQSAVKWSSDDERWQPREMRGADRKRKLPRGQGLRMHGEPDSVLFLNLVICTEQDSRIYIWLTLCGLLSLTITWIARTTTGQVIVSLRSRPLDKAWFLTACHVYVVTPPPPGRQRRRQFFGGGGGGIWRWRRLPKLKTQEPFETKHWKNRVWMYSQK